MKRIAFPIVMTAILVTGFMLTNASSSARQSVSEEDLLRSGHTVDYRCGAAAATNAEPIQLAAAIGCETYADGTCVDETAVCGAFGSKKKKNTNTGVCTNVINKHKRVSCACVK